MDFVSEENGYVCNYVESAGHPMAKLFGLSTVGFGGPLINVRRTQAEAVMRYRLPVMTEDLSKNRWYNWGPPPPGERLGGPAVTTNCFGRGRAVYLGPPVFRSLGAGTLRELGQAVDPGSHPADRALSHCGAPRQSRF